jgi:hypothetical protein
MTEACHVNVVADTGICAIQTIQVNVLDSLWDYSQIEYTRTQTSQPVDFNVAYGSALRELGLAKSSVLP